MKHKYISALTLLSLLTNNLAYAAYEVHVYLDPRAVDFKDTPIKGTIGFNPSIINRGQSSTLSWDYDYVNSVNIEGIGKFDKKGSINLSPLTSKTYKVSINKGKLVEKVDLNLIVSQPTPMADFYASSNRIGIGQSVDLLWNVTNAEKVSIDNGLGNNLPLTGSLSITPTADTTYKLEAIGYENLESVYKYVSIDVVDNSKINSFQANPLKITTGESSTFNWNVSDSENLELYPFGTVDKSKNSQTVQFLTAGTFDYTLKTTSLNGSVISSSPVTVEVYNPTEITSFKVNNSTSNINVSMNDPLEFSWITKNSSTLKLNNEVVTGSSVSLFAPNTLGTTNYTLTSINGAGAQVNRLLSVTTVADSTIESFNAPSTVFVNSPFNLTWTGSGVSNYSLTANSSSAGITTSHDNLGSALSTTVTPTLNGSFTYTLNAVNTANKSIAMNKTVNVENLPSLNGLLVNGETDITVSPNTPLNFTAGGISNGSSLQSVEANNQSETVFPSKSPTSSGTYQYAAVAKKTLNGITKTSAKKTVNVTVVDDPVITTLNAPSNVFANADFTLNWKTTNSDNIVLSSDNNASGIATTGLVVTGESVVIKPTAAGTYNYTITSTNAAGVSKNRSIAVNVEDNPIFTGFTVNGQSTINVAPNATLSFAGSGFSSGASLAGRNSSNTVNQALPTTASSTPGTTVYYASANKTLNSIIRNSAVRNVTVNVIDAPVIGTITAPTNVFANAAFTASWTGTDVVSYTIKANTAGAGVSTSDVTLNATTSMSITPTAVGTYTYTLTATNSVGTTSTKSFSVTVEADPTFTGFTVNGSTSANVSPSVALTFAGAGISSGAIGQARTIGNDGNLTFPTTASATAGTSTYYMAAAKTLNGINRYSALRSVTVTVVSAPTIGAITAPSNVFANAPFTISWSGTGVTSYTITGNNATSGVATTGKALASAVSDSVTPTAAGTYVYTITATNSVGATVTSTKTVIVEGNPTISTPTVNGATGFANIATNGVMTPNATLSSGATLVSNVPARASVYPGETTYSFSAEKTLNGVKRTTNTLTMVVGAGSLYNIVVGYYREPTQGYFGWGYVNAVTGWVPYNNGSMSSYTMAGYQTIGVYNTSQTPSTINISFNNTPNGIIAGKAINLNGVLCTSQTPIYDLFGGGLDIYTYPGCSTNLQNLTGNTVKLYLQN